ncbi:MAG: hypothetical protein SFW35_09670 [Chitinophagales bacterium]|nr:hypothetical protein [Chitinophagales bacterium]
MRVWKYFTIVLFLSLSSYNALAQQPNVLIRKYKWTYNQKPQVMTFRFSQNDYLYYRHLARGQNYADFTREDQEHAVVSAFARAIRAKADFLKLSEWQRVNYVVAFVQGLKYVKDANDKIEYAKYPVETLVDLGGDCEDSAILLAALLDEMGYATILISPPGHMAVGIACADCQGSYIDYKGRKYYYTETTSTGWKIGELPYEHSKNFVSKVYPIQRENGYDSYSFRKNYSSSERYDETIRSQPWVSPQGTSSKKAPLHVELIISNDGKVRKVVKP